MPLDAHAHAIAPALLEASARAGKRDGVDVIVSAAGPPRVSFEDSLHFHPFYAGRLRTPMARIVRIAETRPPRRLRL